jgi:hypothetical protein
MRLFNFKRAFVRQIVQRSKELRVECNRAGHTYVEMGNDGMLAYQPRPEPSILSARHDHTKARRSDPRTTLGRAAPPIHRPPILVKSQAAARVGSVGGGPYAQMGS